MSLHSKRPPRLRIWFVNRFYWPDEPATAQLLEDLARSLAARGHEVHVLCSRPAGATPPADRDDGVRVHRLKLPRFPGASLPAKAASFLGFLCVAPLVLLTKLGRDDRVVVLSDPPLMGFAALLPVALHRALLFNWVQDIHPEASQRLAGRGLSSLLLRALLPPRNLSWALAARNVAPSPSMAARITATAPTAPHALVVHNWPPAGLQPAPQEQVDEARARLGLKDRCVVMYSGNLGRVHDMEALAGLIARLAPDEHFAFVVVGGGAGLPRLRALLERAGHLGRVLFLPPAPRASLAVSLSCADLHLVSLLPGQEDLVFPSKLYGIAAIRRAVLAIAPRESDLVRLVRASRLGAAEPAEALDALAEQARQLSRDPQLRATVAAAGESFLAATGDASRAAAFWESLLASPDGETTSFNEEDPAPR